MGRERFVFGLWKKKPARQFSKLHKKSVESCDNWLFKELLGAALIIYNIFAVAFFEVFEGTLEFSFAVNLFSSLLCYFTLLGVFVITIIHCLFLSLSPFNSMNIFLQNYYNYKPVSIFLLQLPDLWLGPHSQMTRRESIGHRLWWLEMLRKVRSSPISGFQNKKSPPIGNFPSYSHLTTVSCLFCIFRTIFLRERTAIIFLPEKSETSTVRVLIFGANGSSYDPLSLLKNRSMIRFGKKSCTAWHWWTLALKITWPLLRLFNCPLSRAL